MMTQIFIKKPVVKGKPARERRHRVTAALWGVFICVAEEKLGVVFGERE